MKLSRNKFRWSIVSFAVSAFFLFGLNGCKIASIRLVIHSSDPYVQLGTIKIKHHAPEVITVMVIRHAERANDSLTPEGEKRAETLARLLRDQELSAIFSTKTNRTIETVNNTADRLGLSIQFYNSPSDVANLIKSEYVGKVVLVVGHSPTVPQIIHALGVSPVPSIGEEFNNLFFVTIRNDGVATLTHLKYDIHQDL